MSKLPVADFLTQRVAEYDPTFELRKGTGFEQLFFKPLQFITQPIIDEANRMEVAQSLRRILQTDDPDSYDEESVDSLVSNVFVYRTEGGKSSGIARVFYREPVNREFPAQGATFFGSNQKVYTNPAPFKITRSQMWLNIDKTLYYFDIPVESEEYGEDTELEKDGLVALNEDTEYVSVTNPAKIQGGRKRETNTQLIERARNSIAVRDLVTGKGFNATLFENFPNNVSELQPIGMGDEEMMRDILFNTHVGGKIDGFMKSPKIQRGSKIFSGILVDFTRQARSTSDLQLFGTKTESLGNTNIDRSNAKNPIVKQVKPVTAAFYTSTVNLSAPIDLRFHRYVTIGVDGAAPKTVLVAGIHPAQTTRNEIVAYINAAFGYKLAIPTGNTIKLLSPTKGRTSQILIMNPDPDVYGPSAITDIFGLASQPSNITHEFNGDGPMVFAEGSHYTIDDLNGEIARVIGISIISPQTTGETTQGSTSFVDVTPGRFVPVVANDILTVTSGAGAGDYRILAVNGDTLTLDKALTEDDSGVSYYITRTGIKDGEMVYIEYWYNPLSIDIGKYVKLDAEGKTRGIRPGREKWTITDVAFLRIRKITPVDPITGEPLGSALIGSGGFGMGGYGEGPYGIGSEPDYYMVVNDPTARFSAWEDAFIVFKSAFEGLSLQVEYDYVPDVESLHLFVRGEAERVLDGDILMRHYIPAYVGGTIYYKVDKTDSSIPSNDVLQQRVRDFVSSRKAGASLDYTDINNYIMRATDPHAHYGTKIRSYKLTATIHNTDGTTSSVTGVDSLAIVKEDPFPKFTTRPLTPRICHWIGDEELVLVRE